ncbi:MAG TPA: heavy metal sensor histidine kinase [Methylibium sp.]|uniref:heavy metal sensor histidine kinase n=1 Tax=Methylibium sp. TaxID=2067992 RepID=UPI002DBF189E|nr:heavy metal sensor histidine kinase [Methylibium sp.]HEU4459929.1 heavy metal sensor histidine kinase [Methylibium sp.]
MNRHPPSLGAKLSLWLAVQGLLAALVVSAIVYALNRATLADRQTEELELKQQVIRHALLETASPPNLPELSHKLTDFLAGHPDMALAVKSEERVLFEAAPGPQAKSHGDRYVTLNWRAEWPPDQPVDVALRLDVSRDDALLQRLGLALLGASLAAAAVVAITGFALVRRGLLPVRRLVEQVDAVALRRGDLLLDGSAQPHELLPLVEHFNALLTRVDHAVAQLQGFNADVAHELRTPLTTLIGLSELALRRERPADELRDVIEGNLEDLRRLSGIVNDMLFVAQAEHGVTARLAPVPSLAAAFSDILDFHDAALREQGLSATVEGDAHGDFDAALLRRALSNLLSNAARYARVGTKVRIRIAPTPAGRLRIVVENDGEPIVEPHLPRLFDRFYRVERSRRPDGNHHGLGLSIVAAIARMHGGTPFASSVEGVTSIGLEIPWRAAGETVDRVTMHDGTASARLPTPVSQTGDDVQSERLKREAGLSDGGAAPKMTESS